MKKISFLLFVPFVFCYCAKDVEDTIEITVKEFKTGAPVTNASLVLQECTDIFFCTPLLTTYVAGSGAVGSFLVPTVFWNNSDFNEVNHADYHTLTNVSASPIILTRVVWIRLKLVHTSAFNGQVRLSVSPEDNLMQMTIPYYNFPTSSADQTILVKAFGNQVNRIGWTISANNVVIASGNTTHAVPPEGTIDATLNY